MSRKAGYLCVAIVFIGLIAGICVYRIQSKEDSGHLGKDIVYFGDSSEQTKDAKAKGEESTASLSPSDAPNAEPSVAPTAKPYPHIKSKAALEIYESTGTVVVGNAGYELYNYVDSNASRYAKAINQFTKKVGSGVSVYEMIIPTSVGITFPDNKLKQINSSSQEEALKNMEKKLSGREIFISLYDTMMRHRKEYIYFRTDHHWTQLGAYYAYEAFCQAKGIEVNPITGYQKKVAKGFLGSIYVDANKNGHLKQDNVEMYYPLDSQSLKMQYQTEDNKTMNGSIISDPSNFGSNGKYWAFIEGDNPYSVITNPKKQDGSSCVVVKESFANALVPFLTDHYQKIYVIDYRYWTGKLTDFIKQKRVKDVLIVNNISMTRNAYLIGMLAKML